MKCHGCNGSGWVDSEHKGPHVCPLCKGSGGVKPKDNKYDQDVTWVNIVNEGEASLETKLLTKVSELDVGDDPFEVVVHLYTDRPITPQGNLWTDIMQGGITTPNRKLSEDQLAARGYLLNENGEVVTYNDVPVGPIFNALEHWAATRKNILDIKLDPNRKGNPTFVDNNMMAFVVKFESKKDIVGDMGRLYDLLRSVDYPVFICRIVNWDLAKI